MIFKGIALTALVASTPLAIYSSQQPQNGEAPPAAERALEQQRDRLRLEADIKRARVKVEVARSEADKLRAQLDAALDRLDGQVEPVHERNCSPSRSRMLMSHYQWLREQGHEDRAGLALHKVVERVGEDTGRLNAMAWNLMTDKDTAGKFDEVALALTQRMLAIAAGEKHRDLSHNLLDTVALAHFLNGEVERAVELQRQAIAKGGRGDDYRRRLRTYEAAFAVLERAQRGAVERPAATMVANVTSDEE